MKNLSVENITKMWNDFTRKLEAINRNVGWVSRRSIKKYVDVELGDGTKVIQRAIIEKTSGDKN